MSLPFPLPREQYLTKNEARIRSRALPVNRPGPLALDHLTIIEGVDDSLQAHLKAAEQHRAMHRIAHEEHHRHIAAALLQTKLWHLDRLETILNS
jgi:hypothetical protein